jgi:hypothetical protein
MISRSTPCPTIFFRGLRWRCAAGHQRAALLHRGLYEFRPHRAGVGQDPAAQSPFQDPKPRANTMAWRWRWTSRSTRGRQRSVARSWRRSGEYAKRSEVNGVPASSSAALQRVAWGAPVAPRSLMQAPKKTSSWTRTSTGRRGAPSPRSELPPPLRGRCGRKRSSPARQLFLLDRGSLARSWSLGRQGIDDDLRQIVNNLKGPMPSMSAGQGRPRRGE